MGQRLDSPLLREVLRDRPFAYWPMDDFYSGPNNIPKEVTDRQTLTRNVAGFSWNAQNLIRGDVRSIEFFGGVYLSGGTGAPFSPHAGASGQMSMELILKTPSVLVNSSMLISKGNGSNYEYTVMFHANGQIEMDFYSLAGANIVQLGSPLGVLAASTIYLIDVIYNRVTNEAAIYLNGNRSAYVSGGLAGNTAAGSAAFQIGHRADGGGTTLGSSNPAGMGHVSLYNYALSPARVNAHYRAFQHGPRRFA